MVVTPHLGGGTRESRLRSALTMAEDAVRIIRGDLPKHLVNKEVLERRRIMSTNDVSLMIGRSASSG